MQISVSDGMATIALLVSIYTLYQTAKYRRGDHLLSATKEYAELAEIIPRLEESTKSLNYRWRAALSARGMLHSGLAKIKDATSDELQLKVAGLKTDYAEISNPNVPTERNNAERILQKLIALRARADSISSAIDDEESEMKQ